MYATPGPDQQLVQEVGASIATLVNLPVWWPARSWRNGAVATLMHHTSGLIADLREAQTNANFLSGQLRTANCRLLETSSRNALLQREARRQEAVSNLATAIGKVMSWIVRDLTRVKWPAPDVELEYDQLGTPTTYTVVGYQPMELIVEFGGYEPQVRLRNIVTGRRAPAFALRDNRLPAEVFMALEALFGVKLHKADVPARLRNEMFDQATKTISAEEVLLHVLAVTDCGDSQCIVHGENSNPDVAAALHILAETQVDMIYGYYGIPG